MKKSLTILVFLAFCANQSILAQSVAAYQFVSSSGSFSSISATGTASTAGGGNGHQSNVAIGFNFKFGPTNYTHIAISANGLIHLGSGTAAFSGQSSSNSLSATTVHRPLITPLWDDLNMVNGKIYYQLSGSTPNRVFTVEWKNAWWTGNGAATQNSNFQLKLFEGTNNIQFVYGSMLNDTTTSSASIGIVDSTSFVSITPGSTPTKSTTVANNTIKYASLLPNGTIFTLTPPAADMQNLGLVSPTSPFWGASNTVTSRFRNIGSNTIDFSINNLVVSASVTGPNTTTGSTTINTGTLAPNATVDVTILSNYNMLRSGNYSFKTWGNVSIDLNKANDTVTNVLAVSVPVSYTATRSTGVAFTSIASSGSIPAFATANGNDQLSPAITLPFTFLYNGQSATQVRISTNGFITLDAANTNNSFPTNTIGSNASNRRAIIAPFWDDLTCVGHQPSSNYTAASQLGQSIRYSTSGSTPNRVFTVQWTGMEIYGNTGPDMNFQVKLYETSQKIEFRYGTMIGFDGSLSTEYGYSLGMNGFSSATNLGTSDFMCIQNENGSQFGNTAVDNHRWIPECNTMFSFLPGTISTGTPPAVVTNNECTTQVVLTLQEDTPTSMSCAFYRTAGTSASVSVPTCNASTPGTPDDDVWFRFAVNTYARPVKIDLRCGPGFDGVMQLFSGNCGTMNSLACANATGNGQREFIIQNLAVGNYWVRVYHSGTGSGVSANSKGNFAIFVYDAPIPPANDNISGAVQLFNAANCTQSRPYRTMYAQASSQPICGGTADRDVWFYFKDEYPMQILRITPSSPGNTFNPIVNVYHLGTTLDTTKATAGNIVSCWNKTGVNQAEFDTMDDLIYNNYYAVRIYNATGGSGGTGKFLTCMTNGPGQWTGAVNNDWRTTGNWTKNEIPGANTRTRIPAGRPRYPKLDQQEWAKDLLVDSLATFTMSPGGYINIYNQFKCKGNWVDTCGWVKLYKGNPIPAIAYNKLELVDGTNAYSMTGNASADRIYMLNSGSVLNSNGYVMTIENGIDINGKFLGDGRVAFVNNKLNSIQGKGSFSNVEINQSNNSAASFDDTLSITDTLRLTQGLLSVHDSGMLTIGQKTTSKGIIAFNGGKLGGGQSAHQTHIRLLGDVNAPQISNFNIWGQLDLTIDRPNGIQLGDSCLVGGIFTLQDGDVDMNGHYLCAGSYTSDLNTVNTIGGKIFNNASEGRLLILGTQNVQAINSLKLGNMHELSINYNNDISLGSSFSVGKSLYLNKGRVDLNDMVVTLDTGAMLSEAGGGNSFFGSAGYITTTRDLSSSVSNVNIGGMGLVLSTGSALGNTTINRYHSQLTKGTGKSIYRSFTIQPSNAASIDVQMNYDSLELGISHFDRLRLNKSTDNGVSFSTPTNGFRSSVSGSTMYVGAYGINISNSITLFTASDSGSTPLSPLVVQPGTQAYTGQSVADLAQQLEVYETSTDKVKLSAFPNPFGGNLTISIESPLAGNANLQLMEMNGKSVSTTALSLQQGVNQVELHHAAQLAAGIYLISLKTENGIQTLKVVKH